MKKYLAIYGLAIIILNSCAGTPAPRPNLRGLADTTDECRFMDVVCEDAEKFMDDYEKMDPEKQKKVLPALNSYINHCKEAEKGCRATLK